MKPSGALTIKKHEVQLRVYGGIKSMPTDSELKFTFF